jgi:hypothetical protein
MRYSARSNEVRRFQRPQTAILTGLTTVKKKASKKQAKGRAAKARPRQWRESPPVVGIPAGSGSVTKKSLGRSAAAELLEEVPERHHGVTQSGHLTDIFEVGFGGGESPFELLEEGQDLEGELLLAIGTARESDQGDVRAHQQSQERVLEYKNGQRM